MCFKVLGSQAALIVCFSPLVFSLPAHATTITPGSTVVIASGGTAPGNSSNYDFFGLNGQPVNLTNFTVNAVANSAYGGSGGYSVVAAPGTGAFLTGIAFNRGCNCGLSQVVAAFSPLASGSFDLYVLDGNTDGNTVGNVSVALSVNGGAFTYIASPFYSGTNAFLQFDVTSAAAGDFFQLLATAAPGNYTSLGGVTFGDPAPPPTPEPEPLLLLSTGLLGVAGIVRRRLRG